MLVLTRKKHETIRIGDNVTITVVDFRSGAGGLQVRLGIEAPKEIAVHRQEVYDALQREERGDVDR